MIGLVAAGITLFAALGVWLFLPARARDEIGTAGRGRPEPSAGAGRGRLMAIREEDVQARAGSPARSRV